MAEKLVTMSRERFAELVRAEFVLTALESAGVDNWEGYSDAMKSSFADESLSDMQDRFDAATTDAERARIRKEILDAGYMGVANTIGKDIR